MTNQDQPKREPTWITCRCGARWTALGVAHCAADGCHQTFSGPAAFDQHRSSAGPHGSCQRPADLVNSRGERLLFLRDGIWRAPEMTEEDKAARFGRKP